MAEYSSDKTDKGESEAVLSLEKDDNDNKQENEITISKGSIEPTSDSATMYESSPATTIELPTTTPLTAATTTASQSASGRISPTLFLPEARVRYPLTPEQKEEMKSTKKKKEKKKLKLDEMDPEDLMLRASEKGRFDLVEYSLNKDGLIHECRDSDHYTPLHRASYGGHLDIVKFLIERGANIRAKTLDGWEPLHSACRWGQVEVVAFLLENGADIKAQTHGKQTPLHLAALGVGGSDTLKLLLANKAIDCTMTNNQGETACDIAKRCGKWLELFDQ